MEYAFVTSWLQYVQRMKRKREKRKEKAEAFRTSTRFLILRGISGGVGEGEGGLVLPQLLSHALLAEELGGVLVEGGLLAGGGGGAQVVLDEPMGRAELLEAELAVADDDDRTLAAAGEGAFLRELA